jgi:hypothetical protein
LEEYKIEYETGFYLRARIEPILFPSVICSKVAWPQDKALIHNKEQSGKYFDPRRWMLLSKSSSRIENRSRSKKKWVTNKQTGSIFLSFRSTAGWKNMI